MSKPHKRRGNPEFRHFVSPPALPIEALEARLIELLTPGTFVNLKQVTDKQRHLRDRVLTLPVMAAIIFSLVYRQVRYLSEIVRMLETEGLLWVDAMSVSKQALSQRLMNLPASLFMQMFHQVVERLRGEATKKILIESWLERIQQQFSRLVDCGRVYLRAITTALGAVTGTTEKSLGRQNDDGGRSI